MNNIKAKEFLEKTAKEVLDSGDKMRLGASLGVFGGKAIEHQVNQGRLTGRELLYARIPDDYDTDKGIGPKEKLVKKKPKPKNLADFANNKNVKARIPVWMYDKALADKKEVVLGRRVHPRYISDNVLQSDAKLDEVKRFIKENPDRFKKGIVRSLPGVALIGAGIPIFAKGLDQWRHEPDEE